MASKIIKTTALKCGLLFRPSTPTPPPLLFYWKLLFMFMRLKMFFFLIFQATWFKLVILIKSTNFPFKTIFFLMRKFCASLFFNFLQRKKCFLFTIKIKKTKKKTRLRIFTPVSNQKREREKKKRLNKMRKHFIDRFLIWMGWRVVIVIVIVIILSMYKITSMHWKKNYA